MTIDPHEILISLSVIIILSYLFDILARWTKIPSVLMLIGSGVGLQYLSRYLDYEIFNIDRFLEILGIIGLILIVLEGALDLKIEKGKGRLIRSSLGTAFFTLLATSILIGMLIQGWMNVPFGKAFVNAIPLAVISSAVAIPSISQLRSRKREFLLYESTFSDILGIMLFNFAVQGTGIDDISFSMFTNFSLNLVLIVVISVISTLLLIFFIDRVKMHIKFFLILSLLIAIYSLAKIIHLSSLLLVLAFGLALNNTDLFLKGKLKEYVIGERLDLEVRQLKVITAESAFLIRTFFFILFGYSIQLKTLLEIDVLITGSLIIMIILAVRYIYLKFIVKTSIIPELFVAPRGLITILLFFSIPAAFKIPGFSQGILLFVIIVTSILMLIGFFLNKGKDHEDVRLEPSTSIALDEPFVISGKEEEEEEESPSKL